MGGRTRGGGLLLGGGRLVLGSELGRRFSCHFLLSDGDDWS